MFSIFNIRISCQLSLDIQFLTSLRGVREKVFWFASAMKIVCKINEEMVQSFVEQISSVGLIKIKAITFYIIQCTLESL